MSTSAPFTPTARDHVAALPEAVLGCTSCGPGTEPTAPPDPAQAITESLQANLEEVGDDVAVALGEVPVADADRGRLLTLANRLLRRLATDEAELAAIGASVKREVEAITGWGDRQSEKITRRTSWKRFTLTTLAALLFPDPKAKPKSIDLQYGTVGRRDFERVAKLVDAEKAIARCRATEQFDLVRVQLSTDAQTLEDFIASVILRFDKAEAKGSHLTVTQIAQLEVATLLDGKVEGITAKTALDWNKLKRQPAAALFEIPRNGVDGGVKMETPAPDFFVKVTEA